MPDLPRHVDLSGGTPPENFYVCLIDDHTGVEAWRESVEATDYTIPSSSWCAMTCLRMALLLEEKDAPSLDELFERACKAGVYRHEEGYGWRGALLRELTDFIPSLGFEAQFVQSMNAEDMGRALANGWFVLPRVSPEIRFPRRSKPAKKTGHFVFVYAYEICPKKRLRFRLNNAGGFASLGTQVGVCVSEARLSQVFSGDAILIRAR